MDAISPWGIKDKYKCASLTAAPRYLHRMSLLANQYIKERIKQTLHYIKR